MRLRKKDKRRRIFRERRKGLKRHINWMLNVRKLKMCTWFAATGERPWAALKPCPELPNSPRLGVEVFHKHKDNNHMDPTATRTMKDRDMMVQNKSHAQSRSPQRKGIRITILPYGFRDGSSFSSFI